jgi:hypothetical protein
MGKGCGRALQPMGPLSNDPIFCGVDHGVGYFRYHPDEGKWIALCTNCGGKYNHLKSIEEINSEMIELSKQEFKQICEEIEMEEIEMEEIEMEEIEMEEIEMEEIEMEKSCENVHYNENPHEEVSMFTIYWQDGIKWYIHGKDIADAIVNYGCLDRILEYGERLTGNSFYVEGEDHSYFFDHEKGWKIKPIPNLIGGNLASDELKWNILKKLWTKIQLKGKLNDFLPSSNRLE